MHIPEAIGGVRRAWSLVVINDGAGLPDPMPDIDILGKQKHISQTIICDDAVEIGRAHV